MEHESSERYASAQPESESGDGAQATVPDAEQQHRSTEPQLTGGDGAKAVTPDTEQCVSIAEPQSVCDGGAQAAAPDAEQHRLMEAEFSSGDGAQAAAPDAKQDQLIEPESVPGNGTTSASPDVQQHRSIEPELASGDGAQAAASNVEQHRSIEPESVSGAGTDAAAPDAEQHRSIEPKSLSGDGTEAAAPDANQHRSTEPAVALDNDAQAVAPNSKQPISTSTVPESESASGDGARSLAPDAKHDECARTGVLDPNTVQPAEIAGACVDRTDGGSVVDKLESRVTTQSCTANESTNSMAAAAASIPEINRRSSPEIIRPVAEPAVKLSTSQEASPRSSCSPDIAVNSEQRHDSCDSSSAVEKSKVVVELKSEGSEQFVDSKMVLEVEKSVQEAVAPAKLSEILGATVGDESASDDEHTKSTGKAQSEDVFEEAKDTLEDEDVKDVEEEQEQDEEEAADEDEDEEDASAEEHEKDDDELVDNPAYIPKSGQYYMHDSRNTEESSQQRPARSRADGVWKHDRFDPENQQPKTRRELLTRYGYDIRSDGKPERDVDAAGSVRSNEARAPKSRRAAAQSPPETFATPARGTTGARYSGRRRAGIRAPFEGRRTVATAHDDDDSREFQRYTGRGASRNGREQTAPSARGGRFGYSARDGSDSMASRHTYVRNERRPMRTGRGSMTYAPRGATSPRHDQPPPSHQQRSAAAPGGKRYSTQRAVSVHVNGKDASSAADTAPPRERNNGAPCPGAQQSDPTQQQQHHQPPPPPSRLPVGNMRNAPPSQPPPTNFVINDVVYFDPLPQQLPRNPIPPRSRKRLEIVPPSQKN